MKTNKSNNAGENGRDEPEIEEQAEEKTGSIEETLKKELVALNKKLEEEKDIYLRLSAEFENFRKRTLREREEFVKYANEKIILELIDVYESLERGIENAKKGDNKDKLVEGIELVYKQFKAVLERKNLVPIKALGEKFDHNKHEAMMQIITDEYEDGTIVEEFAKGYMLNGKVIRYSKVKVSKRTSQGEESDIEIT